ncbi:MAG: hypothetical protein NTW21_26250 [Verrucomicrobia bacterium]|nr:hypothetical protein [Verrucomicrobiota bacterium]
MKNTLGSLAALIILATPGNVLAVDNTGTGGTITYQAARGEAVSLAGTWRFRLDPKAEGLPAGWFNQKLPDPIELPGSCEQRGYGEKPGQPDLGRLTHVLTHVGPAWYRRDLVIPQEWTGKRVELFLERCHWETTVWVDGRKIGNHPQAFEFKRFMDKNA